MRHPIKKRLSKKIFKYGAAKVHKKNLYTHFARGGIRL